MSKIIRLTEADLMRLVKRVIKEQSENMIKEELGDLKEEIQSNLSWDAWRDADDLMVIYNKLLPYKGKKVGGVQSKRYAACDWDRTEMPALHYFFKIYPITANNRYCMGNTALKSFDRIIGKIGDKTFSGDVEKTKDGKYTTSQVKSMIIDLVNKG